MTKLNFDAVTKEALTGRQTGTLVAEVQIIKEVVVGEQLGYSGPAGMPVVLKESLIGDQVGTLARIQPSFKEALTGSRIGQDLKPAVMHAMKEVIGRDSSYKFRNSHKEVIVSAPNDMVIVRYTLRADRQLVAQYKARTPAPSVWSIMTVPVYRMVVGRSNKRPKPISIERVFTLHYQSAVRAARKPPREIASEFRVKNEWQLIAKSRAIAYNPVSGNFVGHVTQLAARGRGAVMLPVDARGPIIVPREVQLVAISTRVAYQLRVPQVFQLIARTRSAVIFTTPTRAASEVQQVAAAITVPGSQRSPMDTMTDVQQIAQRRITGGIIRSEIVMFTVSGLVAQRRDAAPPHSVTDVAADVQQIAQRTVTPDPATAFGDINVPGQVQQIAQHRDPSPLPYTGEFAQTAMLLTAQRIDALPPNATSDWRVAAQQTLTAQMISTNGILHSFIDVPVYRIQYGQRKGYPLPDDMMGPEVGVQVKQHWQQSAQRRLLESPDTVVYLSRFVYVLAQRPVVRSPYPDKATPYSEINADLVAHQVAVGDQMPDPYLAFSDAVGFSVVENVTLLDDTWSDPTLVVSDAVVTELHMDVLLGDDEMPDPTIPVSDVTGYTVGQLAVLYDDELPDPTIVISDLRTQLVGAIPVVSDPSFIDPVAPTSPADLFVVTQSVLVRDMTMLTIPARADRRRPVISVSIS